MSRRSSSSRRASTALLVLLVTAGGCGSDVPEVDCDTAEVLPYSQLGGSFVYCNSCHGPNRAEGGIRTDSYAEAKRNAEAIEASIADGSMPPETEMPAKDAERIYAWVQCGTPE